MKVALTILFALVCLSLAQEANIVAQCDFKAVPITEEQLACEVDDDCTQVDNTCCGSCQPVAVNVASKDSILEALRRCPNFVSPSTCPCRPILCPAVVDTKVPKCVNKVCQRVETGNIGPLPVDPRPNPPAPSKEQQACKTDEDCTAVCTDCCGCSCGATSLPINKTSYQQVADAVEKYCSNAQINCPMIACFQDATPTMVCEKGYCVALNEDEVPVPEPQPQPSSPQILPVPAPIEPPTRKCYVTGCDGERCEPKPNVYACPAIYREYTCEEKCHQAARSCEFTKYGCEMVIPKDKYEEYLACLKACNSSSIPKCPDERVVQCLRDPCQGATCDRPGVKCIATYCGNCDPTWIDVETNQVVKCEVPKCNYKTCSECQSDPNCAWCSGPSLNIVSLDGIAPDPIAQCFPIHYQSRCAHYGFEIYHKESEKFCPADAPRKTEDTANPIMVEDVQAAVVAESAGSPIENLWTIVITLVERQRKTGTELVNVFIDLIGSTIPTESDYDKICAIIKRAVAPQLGVKADTIKCSLGTLSTKKRDTQLMAILSYQSQEAYAPSIAFNLALILGAIALILF